jgi:hypothetical protein
MSLIAEVIKYGKDIVLLGERVDALMSGRKETTGRLEDHERRLIRIETLIELSQARRRAHGLCVSSHGADRVRAKAGPWRDSTTSAD